MWSQSGKRGSPDKAVTCKRVSREEKNLIKDKGAISKCLLSPLPTLKAVVAVPTFLRWRSQRLQKGLSGVAFNVNRDVAQSREVTGCRPCAEAVPKVLLLLPGVYSK